MAENETLEDRLEKCARYLKANCKDCEGCQFEVVDGEETHCRINGLLPCDWEVCDMKENEKSAKEVWESLPEEEKEKISKQLEETASKVEPYSLDNVVNALDKFVDAFSERMDKLCKEFTNIFCGEEQEEEKMEPTSKQVINGCNFVNIYQGPDGESTRLTLKNDDDIFEIEINGHESYEAFRRLIFNDHNCNEVRKKNQELADEIVVLRNENMRWRKEAADCLKLRDERKEESMRLKEENQNLRDDIMRLKGDLHNIKKAKFVRENSVFGLDDTNNAVLIIEENENLKEEVKRLREEISRCNKVNEDLGTHAIELEKKISGIRKNSDDLKRCCNSIGPVSEEPSSRRDILRCAEECVCGKREQDYGTPESNFQIIADLWNGYLGGRTDNPVISVTPVDVAMMMALMKIARIRNGGGTGDSFVDLAGYAACGGEINAKNKKV